MTCSRRECEEIMCRTYVPTVGYICSDCKTEFKEYLKNNKIYPTTDAEVTKELDVFMETSKESTIEAPLSPISIDAFFDERTRG